MAFFGTCCRGWPFSVCIKDGIFIDPPYNTGGDFVYPDDFSDSIENYKKLTGQVDDDGKKLSTNSEANGRYHTDWLNMMYPRLRLARNLLTDDGAIFISIDDNEIENIRRICDEVFGEENFFCQVVIQSNKRGQTYKQISKTHEYLLIYTKNPDAEFYEIEKRDDTSDLNLEDTLGKYNIRELRNRNPKFGKFNRPGLYYPIYVDPTTLDKDGFCPISLEQSKKYVIEIFPLNSSGEESCWRWGKPLAGNNMSDDTQNCNLVAKQKRDGGFNIYEKYRKTTYKAKSIWDEVDVITEKGTVELGELELSKYFDFPKPIALVKKAIAIEAACNDIILDFFSGSATTAHAVMQLNAEDGGNRKFIMVQLPEPCAEGTEAAKAGYQNICEIGKERIRRAGEKIQELNKAKSNMPLLDTEDDMQCKQSSKMHTFSPANAHFFTASF
jgi:adenine-specific DNA-methyltransferase